MDDARLLKILSACERAVWDALVTGDAQADAALLDDRFLGVYPDGYAGKAEHAGQLSAGPTIQDYDLSDMRVLALGPDHCLLAYRAKYRRIGRRDAEHMYVSSIWHQSAGGWVNVFSQDTPASGVAVP